MENSNNHFRTLDQLQSYDIPILGTIPTINNPEQILGVRRLDTIVYVAAAVYFAGILGILLLETYKRIF